MLSSFRRLSRAELLIIAASMIVAVALLDWRVELNVSFGFLYLFPMLIVGSCLPGWQLALLAGLCTFLAERFAPFSWEPADGVPRDIFMFAAFIGTGLFAYQSAKNRQLSSQHVREVEQEAGLRRDAEQQLKALIESSPAAILTVDSKGRIVMANQAAHRLLGFEPETLPGESIQDFLPPLAGVPPGQRIHAQLQNRHAMQRPPPGWGGVSSGCLVLHLPDQRRTKRLAAMLVDSSDELRDQEESSLHHLMVASRLAVGAVSHEIRNVCGAISVVYENLSRHGELAEAKTSAPWGIWWKVWGKSPPWSFIKARAARNWSPWTWRGSGRTAHRDRTGVARVRCAGPLGGAQEPAPGMGGAP